MRAAEVESMSKSMSKRIVAATLLLFQAQALASEVRLVHHPRQTNPDFNGNPRMIVKDADAKHGTAQAAIPGKSKPGGPICSFYSYARPAGIYRVTWRVKVDDNTIDKPVFRASTGKGSIALKGTDFEKSNVYQEFSYTAEKGEGGFFGVGARWPGKGTVHVDRITVVSEKLYTEREMLEKKGGLKLPDFWSFPAPTPPRIHIAKGLWWDFFGVSEAISELGGAFVSVSYHGKGQWGTSLRYFPSSWQGMMGHNVVILANVDAAALRARGRLLIEVFVTNGGALLVLGGPFAFKRGGYQHTALEKLLPCQMVGRGRQKAEGGFIMKPTDAAKEILPDDLSWQLDPRLYYYHTLEAKPEARVLVTAEEKPIVATWETGKGRVAVIAATAEGMSGPDQLAFWEWGDMPRLVAAVCQWLVSIPRDEKPVVMDEEARKQLEKLAMPNPGEKESDRQRLLAKLLLKCRDKTFAREILSTVNNAESDPSRRFVEAVSRTVRPFVDEEFSEEAEALIESGVTGKAALGLRILGLCRSEDAGGTLACFLEKGTDAFSAGGDVDDLLGTGGGLSVDAGLEIGANERLKLAAVFGLGDLGDRDYLRPLQKATREFSKKRQLLTEATDVPDLNESTYQQSLAARCRLGDPKAAGPFLDAILRNEEEVEQFLNAFDVMLVNKDDKKLMNMRKVGRIRLPILHRRQVLCMKMLRKVPYSLAGQFAKELAKRSHPILTSFGFAALSPSADRELTADVAKSMLPLISDCRIAELRRFTCRLVLDLQDPGATAQLTEMLAEVAADTDPVSARFALRAVSRLQQKDRVPVISAGMKHPDEKIRRLARLSLPLLSEEQRKSLPADKE